MNRQQKRANKDFLAWLGEIYYLELSPQDQQTMRNQHKIGISAEQKFRQLQEKYENP